MARNEDGLVTVSTGVVFRIMDVPVLAFDEVRRKVERERPPVPVVWIDGKDREEVNPQDPGYLKALEDFDLKLAEAMIGAALVLGLEVVELPDGFCGPDDDAWTEKYHVLGIDIPPKTDAIARQLAWTRLWAAPKAKDLALLTVGVQQKAGVLETEVAEVSALFRDKPKRRANSPARVKKRH